VSRWLDYREVRASPESTVVGDLRILPDLDWPEERQRRDVLVHLPPGAMTSGRRYPVLYMHDGQNLFDAATSFAGEWQVDETLESLAREGLELIVVGVPNGGDRRAHEYTPFRTWYRLRRVGGGGSAYLRFLVDVVKPEVDATFPTRPEREATGIMGSSLGGLISLWAAIEHPSTFGLVGAMSPAVLPGQDSVLDRLRRLTPLPERVYLDVGGREAGDRRTGTVEVARSRRFVGGVVAIRDALEAAGLREPRSLRYLEDPEAYHHESAWADRLPDALRFLFGPLTEAV
jgi:predicted alpha/beta superfamily hydrolase